MPVVKSRKEEQNRDIINIDDVEREAKTFIERVLGDISKTSASKQMLMGASSGWLTGFLAMKVGKTAAFALGGGIILLQVANQKGYIKINWDKVNNKLDKVSDKVEQQITGQGPSWINKVSSFARSNTSFSAGFIGGFFIGVASH